ncbi:MAG: hypothetical protein U9N51_12095 [Bacteroidota bacterium]|nr:hypothetical protein [Bacteroidota bacterium]
MTGLFTKKNEKGVSVAMGLTYFPHNANEIAPYLEHNSGYVSP